MPISKSSPKWLLTWESNPWWYVYKTSQGRILKEGGPFNLKGPDITLGVNTTWSIYLLKTQDTGSTIYLNTTVMMHDQGQGLIDSFGEEPGIL